MLTIISVVTVLVGLLFGFWKSYRAGFQSARNRQLLQEVEDKNDLIERTNKAIAAGDSAGVDDKRLREDDGYKRESTIDD